jgi:hypothetical protein
MTLLGEQDPEHWLHTVAAGRSLLTAAASELTSMHLSGALLKGAEANMYLIRSLVSEAQARKMALEAVDQSEDSTVDFVEDLIKIAELFKKAQDPLRSNEATLCGITSCLLWISH